MNESKIYPLTHAQKRIWYVEHIYPGTSIHNIGGLIKIYGPANFDMLEEAINLFIQQNEAIRIRLVERNGDVQQTVSEYQRRIFPRIDFTKADSYVDVDTWLHAEFSRPFSLNGEFLYDFALVKLDIGESAYLTKVHHIISDGWSFQLMTTQINQIYTQLMNGEEVNQNLRHSYLDYTRQEQQYLSSSRFLKNKQYWLEKFEGIQDVNLHASYANTEGRRKTFILNQSMSEKIRDFTNKHRISLNTFFVAAMLLYLHKVTQQDRITLGTPVLNRSGAKEKNMFGMFTSTMPLFAEIQHEMSFSAFALYVNRELMQCYFHQRYPYNLLVQDLQLQKRGIDQLFQVCVNYYNTRFDRKFGPGWRMQQIEIHNGHQLYPLQLIVTDWLSNGGMELYFDYKTSDYNETQIEDMFHRLCHIADQILMQPDEQVTSLQMLFPEERFKLLYSSNSSSCDYPLHKTIGQLFEEQVKQTPDRVAVTYGTQSLTYRELNERANQLARILVHRGIGSSQTLIAIMARHSLEMVIGIWSVIKAGGAYLPIDPDYPKERIEYILRDSSAALLLTTSREWKEGYPYNEGSVLLLDDEQLYIGEKEDLSIPVKPEDLVYVIYTSGSTGNPKGTMIKHRGLVNYICWASKTYIRDLDDVFALYSSIAFDLTVTSIFTPLISGNRIEIYDSDGSEFVLNRILQDNKVTVIKLTPAHLSLIKNLNVTESSVRTLIVGGEDLKTLLAGQIYKNFQGEVDIYNEYGPTETVVGCMIHRFDPESDKGASVSIGNAIDNMQIYLLDKWLEPVPAGAVGEIYISGEGVARGYLHRAELTAERFLDNLYMPGYKMYKTGDLAIRSDEGGITYLGRIDHQVKIKGYRIELGEIEHQLLTLKQIGEAAVIDFRGNDEQPYLVAYYVAERELPSLKLRKQLAEVLPSYMIPAYFIRLDKLPLTANGKVNRAMLPLPDKTPVTEKSIEISPAEILLTDIFKEVLRVENVGRNDNFYRLGGDSIKAIQIVSKINGAGYGIKVKDVLSYPTIEELASLLVSNTLRPIEQGLCEGKVSPLPIIHWFKSRGWNNPHYYAQSILLTLKKEVTSEELKNAIYSLIQHHDSLRLQYDMENDYLIYKSVNQEELELYQFDLSGCPPSEQTDILKRKAEMVKASLRINEGLPIKAALFNMGEKGKRLLLTAHHLVVDGISWRILLEDFDHLLQSAMSGQIVSLAPKTHSIQAWSEAIDAYGQEQVLEHSAYWQEVVHNREDVLTPDFSSEDDRIAVCTTLVRELSEGVTRKLLGEANEAFRTQTNDLLVTSLAMAIGERSGRDNMTIELEGHGREELFDLDISRTVGWFTSIYPVNIRLPSKGTAEILKYVKEKLREIPNKGIDYGILVYLARHIKDQSQGSIRFNYMGEIDNHLQSTLIGIATEDTGSDMCPGNRLLCLVDIVAMVIGNKLRISVTYSTSKFNKDTMEMFADAFVRKITEIVDFCENSEQADFTPSDFDTVNLSQGELDVLFNG